MRKNPAFTAVAIVTLALGIGANTAIFSVVYAVLLRQIPYPAEDPDRVILLREKDKRYENGFGVAYPDYKDWQQQQQSFSDMGSFRNTGQNLTGIDEPINVPVRMASYNYFDIMGVKPLLGRLFTPDDDRVGAERVALLNQRIWQNRYGADPDIAGRTLRLDDTVYTIVGVVPNSIDLRDQERVFIPLELWPENENVRDRGNHMDLSVLARLKPGVSFERAETEMNAIAQRLEQQYPRSNSGVEVKADVFNEMRTQDYRAILWLLLGAVVCVLLIACTNVGNLLLARAVSRQRETAIQASLGASRWRIIRQTLTECLVVSFIGAALGLAVAYGSLHFMRGMLPENMPRLHEVAIDWTVLAFTFGLSLLTAVLFGLAPALGASRVDLNEFLKEGGRGGSLMGRRRLGRGFLAAEVALATVLLIGAGLLIRTVHGLTQVDPGFDAGRLLKMQLGLSGENYRGNARVQFYREVERRMEALPGVESVAVGLSNPMMFSHWTSIFITKDKPVPPRAELPSSIFNPVDYGYFKTFGLRLKAGRFFDESDTADSRRVVVINEALAERIWPGESAIGKQLKQGWPEDEGENHPWREVVGVAGNTKQDGLHAETRMETYLPLTQNGLSWAKVTLRTSVDPMSLADPAKGVIRSMDPNLPVSDIETLDEVIAASLAPRRVTMILLGAFAGLALLLAAIGLYGVLAYTVARRRQEIGVRMAVGAQRRDIFRLVVGQGMFVAAIGAIAGVGGAFGATRFLSTMLYGVTTTDALVFTSVPLILAVVAFAACALPARRAVGVDPITALRYE